MFQYDVFCNLKIVFKVPTVVVCPAQSKNTMTGTAGPGTTGAGRQLACPDNIALTVKGGPNSSKLHNNHPEVIPRLSVGRGMKLRDP
ncbi:hypothetical protein BSPA111_37670 [Buttiauxella sp. A111]|nr:hypothetical protein BSPA111_37670 [Buttiauxella sp. A111]